MPKQLNDRLRFIFSNHTNLCFESKFVQITWYYYSFKQCISYCMHFNIRYTATGQWKTSTITFGKHKYSDGPGNKMR